MNSIQNNNFMKPHRSANFLLANFIAPADSGSVATPPPPPDREEEEEEEDDDVTPPVINEKKIDEVWSKHNFDARDKVKVENMAILENVKTTWGASSGEDDSTTDRQQRHRRQETEEEEEEDETSVAKGSNVTDPDSTSPQSLEPPSEETSPSHHARRPPNAFLIFCKKHRPIVRQRYPNTENRGVTKILGEWWALLNIAEKQPYNDLAKEYKDAFLTANPGFRWYKLPAPPLRTLTTRPATISKAPPPTSVIATPPPVPTYLSEFTPGKLADESQLGGLTSLMNNNYTMSKKIEEEEQEEEDCCKIEDNNNENLTADGLTVPDKYKEIFASPTSVNKPAEMPATPIKKRIFEGYHDEEKSCAKNIFEKQQQNGSLTQQDLLNKVVDGIFANDREEPKEQRKSDRMCKGKRYERFMFEGRLLSNKKETKLAQHHQRVGRIDSKIDQELTGSRLSQETPKFNLENTIKRLAERTNVKIDYEEESTPKQERARTLSETSDGAPMKSSSQVNFNLDLRIDNLPSLSYEDFIKRKRESKKRKSKIKPDGGHKIQKLDGGGGTSSGARLEAPPVVVGSKKRKNKLSITHLNKNKNETSNNNNNTNNNNNNNAQADGENREEVMLANDSALLGLATLAMVAARTEKIGENMET